MTITRTGDSSRMASTPRVRRSRAVLTAGLSALLAAPIAAQPPLTQGTRVRVFARADSLTRPAGAVSRGWIAGTVVSSTPEALVLSPAPLSEPVVLPTQDVLRIDVSRGRPNHKWRGATIGGLLSGSAFVALSCWFSDGSCNVGENVGGFLAYFAVGAVPGAVVGGARGARQQGPERWQQVWAEARVTAASAEAPRD
jgi:hypothetical protein